MSSHHEHLLNEIYDALPSVICGHCGTCCTLWAGMRYVEYRHVRRYIDSHWAESDISALEERIRRHYRFRSVYVDAPSDLPRLLPASHCLLYDKTKERCRVYPVRPLDCRLYGLSGECDNVMLQNDKTVRASTTVTDFDCTRALRRIASINEDYTDPNTGRTLDRYEAKPIEFWFALFEVGWDRTLDQSDDQFFGSLRS